MSTYVQLLALHQDRPHLLTVDLVVLHDLSPSGGWLPAGSTTTLTLRPAGSPSTQRRARRTLRRLVATDGQATLLDSGPGLVRLLVDGTAHDFTIAAGSLSAPVGAAQPR